MVKQLHVVWSDNKNAILSVVAYGTLAPVITVELDSTHAHYAAIHAILFAYLAAAL